jgi:hypothetical protein
MGLVSRRRQGLIVSPSRLPLANCGAHGIAYGVAILVKIDYILFGRRCQGFRHCTGVD